MAKQDPVAGLTPIDISNLEWIIQAMEAISRFHEITRGFLQQACLDVERNGLDVCIRLPTLTKYRDGFGANPNIPLLARSSVAKHTEISPVLPGRLPLGNPKGTILPRHLRIDKGIGASPGVERIMRELLNRECFQAVLGAVTRNVAAPDRPEVYNHKRKRMSPSPASDSRANRATTSDDGASFSMGSDRGQPTSKRIFPVTQGQFSLPDRTTPSSTSSPANLGTGTGTGTETFSGSSHTSPGLGLGNTAEENRVDLRAFQDRIIAPIWPAAEETFFAQITQTLVHNPLSESIDPWGILDANIDWDAAPTTGS